MNNLKLLRLDEGRTFCLNLEVDIPYEGEDHSEKEILTYVSDAWIERTLHNTLNNPCIHSIFVYGKKIVKRTITDQYRGPKQLLGNGLHLGGNVFTKYLLSVEVEVTISYVTENQKWNPNLYKRWGDESDELDGTIPEGKKVGDVKIASHTRYRVTWYPEQEQEALEARIAALESA